MNFPLFWCSLNARAEKGWQRYTYVCWYALLERGKKEGVQARNKKGFSLLVWVSWRASESGGAVTNQAAGESLARLDVLT